MNDEFRALRVLIVPLALIVLVFILTPRMCARAINRAKEQKAVAPTTSAEPSGLGSTPTGLQIEGSAPRAPVAKSSDYPPGLDSAKIQYLVEIDSQFSAPATARVLKKWAADKPQPVLDALVKLQYAEKQADGNVVITRDGVLKLQNLVDQGDGWTFETAKRAFDDVSFLDRIDDEKYRATFRWHWQANEVGAAIGIKSGDAHSATAEFAGGEHHWALVSWVVSPAESEKNEAEKK